MFCHIHVTVTHATGPKETIPLILSLDDDDTPYLVGTLCTLVLRQRNLFFFVQIRH